MTDSSIAVGIDAGATATKLLGAQPGSASPVLLQGPPVNVQRVGTARAAAVLSDLVLRALDAAAASGRLYVYAGVAGAGRPADRSGLTDALQTLLPATLASLTVVDDATLALEAAHGASSGALVLAGTGSIVRVRTRDGQTGRAGGWGHLLGDEGGGYAIGRAGLATLTEAMDGGPRSLLTDRLADRFELHTPEALIRRVYQSGWPLQEAAPVVLEAAADGDRRAGAIVDREIDTLLDRLQWAIRRLSGVAPRVALVGGLGRSTYYERRFDARLHARFPGWERVTPASSPVEAALQAARRAAAF